MSTGVLIFAFNNEQTDYVSMARWSARNIQRHLGLPVSLVTDLDVNVPEFDKVIKTASPNSSTRMFTDYASLVTWHNTNRMMAFELSPYDTTVLLDADYVVASNRLKSLLSTNYDILCHRSAFDITGVKNFNDLNYFGRHRMPMWWATVVIFKRTRSAELVFKHMAMIKQHWDHYVNLYGIGRSVYRNDHALSIALTTANGHFIPEIAIPWDLASLTPDASLQQQGPDKYRIDFSTPDGKRKWVNVEGMDFHAMGKKQLGDLIANHA